MLSDTIGSLALFQDFIVFSLITLVLLTITASLIRITNWKTPALKIFGVFTGMENVRLITLSLIFIRMMFYLSALLYSTKIELVHICFVIIVTFALQILLLDLNNFIFDSLFSAVIIGELYVGNMLHTYLTDIQIKAGILAAYVLVIIFTLITVLFTTSQCLLSIIKRNMKEKTRLKVKMKMMLYPIVILISGLFITFIPYYFIDRMDTFYINQELFQNTADGVSKFKGESKLSKSNKGCILENEDKLYELKSVPLYYKNEDSIIIPNIVSIVQPDLYLTNRIENMSRIYEKNGQFLVNSDGDEVKVSDFFLFDGRDTYVFFEPITISWQNNSIELSPFSYITVKYNQSIEVFDRSTMNFSSIDTGICNVIAKMHCKAEINMSTDILRREDGQEQMLFIQPNLLKDLI